MSRAKLLPPGSSRRKETKRFVKFAFVGALGSITDRHDPESALVEVAKLAIQLLPPVLGLQRRSPPKLPSESMVDLTRKVAFTVRSMQIAKFALVSVVGLGINLIVFGFSRSTPYAHTGSILLSSAELGFTMSYNSAKLFAIGVVMFWNFAANRLWTFKGL